METSEVDNRAPIVTDSSKRRKVAKDENQVAIHRILVDSKKQSDSLSGNRKTITDHDSSEYNHDQDEAVLLSCCSKNLDSSDHKVNQSVRFSDLKENRVVEDEASTVGGRVGLRSCGQTKSNGRTKKRLREIEEFFAAEESRLLTKFSKKYNFDFKNDVPLEGRYEWLELKP